MNQKDTSRTASLVVETGKPTGRERPRPADVRRTPPYLTRYEQARVLGARAYQLSMGAATTLTSVEKGGHLDPLVLARRELDNGDIPIIIRRYLPDGTYEDWSVPELQVIN
ncbi:DNA-directed RNA polymerase II RPB6 [Giardia muris]|uniref:DNA-directed RNA polymerase II RPB6 n=1 Tax=Giardia muris TaxID=5742 RepID=A0A4Z1SXF9_GIAMU|nr:DNA-directed RNA polymerase II RPB6 [Giardia muris]|eukprot:TNJ29505.1 DNA-directed RNA polymerase II RPB6 [Giardia muris]